MSTVAAGFNATGPGLGNTASDGLGTIAVTSDYRVQSSPDTHHTRAWGSPVSLVLDVGNISTSQAATSLIVGGSIVNPFPYAYLYNIVFNCQAAVISGTAPTVDVFDTDAAGSAAANSYLISPFTLAATGSQGGSARFPITGAAKLSRIFEPLFNDTEIATGAWYAANYTAGTRSIPVVMKEGQIFSIRVVTGSSNSSITSLVVQVVLVPFDHFTSIR
jgi:hypothetical protein